MDYDRTDIPAAYDRGRVRSPEVLDLWMKTVAAHTRNQTIGTILDLGCGTGRFSGALAAHFHANVFGIDPSRKMLAEARRKTSEPSVRYGQGRAEKIPLVDQSVDMIFISMVFHHFDSPEAALTCAVAIQRRLADHRKQHGFAPQVRIGLHASEAAQVEKDFRGKGVHEAARIAALAGAGEIVASKATVGPDPQYPATEPRTVTLKGISEPVDVVSIDWR